MTVGAALLQGAALLESASVPAHRLTAEVLLAHAIGCGRAWLYAHSDEELRQVWWIHYGRYLHQRMQGVPTQQITGRQEFYGREFRVTPDVLIPRPETEHVIEAALARAGGARRIVDIGTGSGAIAITLALETGVAVAGTDVSAAAVRVAAENGRRLGAIVSWVVCDLGAALGPCSCDLVVCNPPYVPAGDQANLQREVRDHEPELALYGGQDGLAVYRRLIPEAARLLRPGGWLVMETSFATCDRVQALLGAWAEVTVGADLAGLPRVVSARDEPRA
jgi:release factor glutamine methyltransferase